MHRVDNRRQNTSVIVTKNVGYYSLSIRCEHADQHVQ